MRKQVLFITTTLDDYYKEISSEIEMLGYEVVVVKDRGYSIIYRIIKKINCQIGKLIERLYYNFEFSRVKKYKFDILFVLRGANLPENFIKNIFANNKNLYSIMYQWDSLKNHDYRYLIKYFNVVYSFDYDDCYNNMGLVYKPLFYIDMYNCDCFYYYLVFIGSYQKERLSIIKEILKSSEINKKNSFFFVHISLPVLIREIIKKNITAADLRMGIIKIKRLRKMSVKKVIQNSRCVLDINSIYQTGLTIRTFEAIGLRKKIITTNSNISKENFYNPGKMLIINRNNLNIDDIVKFIDKPLFDDYDLSVRNWTKSIFKDI